jgi:hypothetical protein
MSPDPASTFVADPSSPQSWNLYSYVFNNPLRFIDPSGLCSQDSSGGYQDDDNGGTFLFSGPCANGSIGNYDPSPTAPPVLNGPDPNNTAVEGNSVTAQSDPFSFANLFNAGLDFITNSIVPVTGTFGVGLPQAKNSIGPQISVTYIPKTHRLCGSGGVYVTTPGSNFINASFGLLVNGPLAKAEAIVSGFGTSGTLQKSLRGGYQVSSSSSGNLGGPTIGTLGASFSAGYGGCITLGRAR